MVINQYNRFFITKEKIMDELSAEIYLNKRSKKYMDIIFLCIGTDKLIGDCFGPLVGTKLKNMLEDYNIFNINIYGTLENNVNYTNIERTVENIYKKHEKPYVIIVDAALSKKDNIGKIYMQKGKTVLGKGLNKYKFEVGDFSIRAVVGKDYKIPKYNFTMLQNVSLNSVIKMADMVSEAIAETIKYN